MSDAEKQGELEKRILEWIRMDREGVAYLEKIFREMWDEFPIKRSDQAPCVEQLIWEEKLEKWFKKWSGR